MNRREPLVSCLISALPQFSRGGMVRSPSVAIFICAGTAPATSGGQTRPPRALSSASRAVQRFSCSCDGATPAVPMNEPLGMRTPGSCGEVAYCGLMSQCTTK